MRAWLLDKLRYFNKYVTNRAALLFAGRKGAPFVVIRHTGRRSGRTYATPVVAQVCDGGFVIPLTYGAEVDWCRNVVAAGGCTLVRDGVEHKLSEPEVVDIAAISSVPRNTAATWRLLGIKQFLRMKEVPEPRT